MRKRQLVKNAAGDLVFKDTWRADGSDGADDGRPGRRPRRSEGRPGRERGRRTHARSHVPGRTACGRRSRNLDVVTTGYETCAACQSQRTITQVGLRGRDPTWTPANVARFLGDPDATAQNPRYKSGAPMRLYKVRRAITAEATPEFAEARVKTLRRSKSARAAAEAKRHETLEWARSVKIEINFDGTAEQARRAGYSHRLEMDSARWRQVTRDSYENVPKPTLNRWAVNWLRHHRTPYESRLDQTYGNIGVREAYDVIRTRVQEAIFGRWPDLWPLDELPFGAAAWQ